MKKKLLCNQDQLGLELTETAIRGAIDYRCASSRGIYISCYFYVNAMASCTNSGPTSDDDESICFPPLRMMVMAW